MSYAQSAGRANPVAIIGALGVPGIFGAILVTGLAIKIAIVEPEPNPAGVFITPKPIDPPPPPPEPIEPTQTDRVTDVPNFTPVTPPVRPTTDFTFSDSPPIPTLPDTGYVPVGPIATGGPIGTPRPTPVPSPKLPDPISAAPRNAPGEWVTTRDYRTNWIRKELTGRAGFALTIDKNGRVADCTITRTSGHGELDAATCKLIEQRARFTPAKDSYGNAVAGKYSSSVNWQIPE